MLKALLGWGRGDRARPGAWVGVAAGALALAFTPGAAAQELNSKLESLIGTSRLTGARIGVSVIDLATGRTLGDIGADAPMIPASNMKLLTSGTALLVLGDEFVFKTELLLDGERLVIRGGGDPALADPAILDRMKPAMSVDGLVEMLAGAVKRAGATHIAQIVIDDRVFDRQYIHPSWPVGQLDKWYCAEVTGLNFHTNVLSAFPGPGAERDRPASYALEPTAPWLEIDNRTKTVGDGENSVWLTREPEANRFTMFGKVRYTTKVPVEITLHEVGLFAGQVLAAELPRSGVGIGTVAPSKGRLSREDMQAATAAVRLAAPGETVTGKSIAVVTTHIRDVLERCNNDSQNLYAESLIKRVGHEVTGEPGSWTNGASVLRMTIKEHLGAEFAASTVVADGSGMSRDDQVTPKTFTRWLEMLQKNPTFGEEFVSSLASPGDGTLRRRFNDIKLHAVLRAKSGKLDGVRCLSGYLTDPLSGNRVAFSIMVNGLKEGDQAIHSLQFHEDVVALCDRWLAGQRSPDQKPTSQRAARAEPSQSRTRGK